MLNVAKMSAEHKRSYKIKKNVMTYYTIHLQMKAAVMKHFSIFYEH